MNVVEFLDESEGGLCVYKSGDIMFIAIFVHTQNVEFWKMVIKFSITVCGICGRGARLTILVVSFSSTAEMLVIFGDFWYLDFLSLHIHIPPTYVPSLWEQKSVRNFTMSERFVSIMRSGFLCRLQYVQVYSSLFEKMGVAPAWQMLTNT
jgi:hypothetical protein